MSGVRKGLSPASLDVPIRDLLFRVFASTRPENASAVPYVIVHGIGVSHRYSSPLHDTLAAEADVYSVDLPGFGGLPKPKRDLTIEEMAGALGEALDAIGVKDAVLIGHSMGTQWVVELALQRPDLASSVVVIGPVTDDRHRSVLAQSAALGIDTLGEPPIANAIIFTDYLRSGPVWYSTQLRHMLAYRLEDKVGDLAVPLLVMRGGKDPIAGTEWCRRVRDSAPRGSLVLVPGHHHVVQYTAPRAVASAITALVTTV
ncbi:alpha/beta fold hydrolase [Micromonospora sp. DT81.3]|uniref:alpha/beta fold hydrolase n=1 Tax=Micromonospora sp. DT81.3 TaxID=3416523 RepID=UPI003CEDBE6A